MEVKSSKKTKKDIVKMLLNQDLGERDEEELIDLLINSPLSVDIDKQEDSSRTFGDRIADKISSIAGSWGFIAGSILFLIFWILLNTVILKDKVDQYPFILLNLLLSCIAALQAPIIMMSQNRQTKKDTLRNKNDYHVDLKSELILELLYEHMNDILKNQKKILSIINETNNENSEKNKE